MIIKSPQTLVSEALKVVKTITPEEALKISSENKCNLIDIRNEAELQKLGRIENSFHIPRGLLEFSIHPESAYVQNNQLDYEAYKDMSRFTTWFKLSDSEFIESYLKKVVPIIKENIKSPFAIVNLRAWKSKPNAKATLHKGRERGARANAHAIPCVVPCMCEGEGQSHATHEKQDR